MKSVILVAVGSVLLIACGGEADPSGCGLRTREDHVDYMDFVRLNGIFYERVGTELGGDALPEDSLGAQFGRVKCSLGSRYRDHSEIRDGDASFMPVGKDLFQVAGYRPEFRLGARGAGSRVQLYEAYLNEGAVLGRDMLDLEGKVESIVATHYPLIWVPNAPPPTGIVITDSSKLARLVSMVLYAPFVEIPSGGPERYDIRFQLRDGTEVSRQLWVSSNQLDSGLALPADFLRLVKAQASAE